MKTYAEMAKELFEIMDPAKFRPPHREVSKLMHGEMAVMRLFEKEDVPLTAGEISRRLRMTTSRIAAVLNSLEKKALISRFADEKDGRRVMVAITQQGRDFLEERRLDVLRHMQDMLEKLGEEDAREYVRLARRVMEIMRCRGETDEERNI